MSGQLLFPNQFIHVLNQDSGEIRTEVGPKRLILNTNEKQLQSEPLNARIVGEDEYAVIKNPYDTKLKKNLMGEIEIREGPAVLCLNYNEVVEDVKKALILSKDQAVKLMATAETEGKPAGFIWQVRGECRFVPNKYTKILSTVQTILINENEGIYVRNVETSEKRLIRGPTAYLLDANEELYVKPYTEMETAALGLGSPTYVATVVKLKKGEVMCVLDAEKNEHILAGPLNYVLGPEEHVKTLYLSAGKPKRPKQIKVAKVKIGPDFMSDKFEVRTKDNANLSLLLTYKWQFLVGETEAYRVFSLPDFIGYSCTTLCSRIREEAAQYTFEEFHAKTVGLIRKAIFTDNIITNNKGEKETVHGLYFDEIKLLISEVDVRDVTPVNEEINSLLNQSIKSNMIIVCKRMEQEANLKSEKEKIQASAQIQKLREGLIDIQNENLSLEKIERARIDGQVQILHAKSQKEAEELQSFASTKIQLDKMKSTIALLNGPGGDKYLELLRAEQIGKIKQQWYVASDSKYALPLQSK